MSRTNKIHSQTRELLSELNLKVKEYTYSLFGNEHSLAYRNRRSISFSFNDNGFRKRYGSIIINGGHIHILPMDNSGEYYAKDINEAINFMKSLSKSNHSWGKAEANLVNVDL